MHDPGPRTKPADGVSKVRAAPGAVANGVDPLRSTPTVGTVAAAVLASSPNAIIAVGANGRISYANPQVESTFGFSPSELVGRSLTVVLPEQARVRHRYHVKKSFSQPTVRAMGIGLDLTGRHRDGREFPVEISLVPVDTDAGIHVFATVVDISARKIAENALAESERRFRAVLEVSPNAVLAVDNAGLITYVNPMVEETFGYPADKLLGKAVDILLPAGFDGRHNAQRDRLLREHVAVPIGIGVELVGRHRGGREFPVEIGTSPVETESGPQIFATIVDISERKTAESELLQAQKMESIGRLAGGIAHDFNNILFAITGYSELLEEDLAGEFTAAVQEAALESVFGIGEAARRGANLTSQLLSFSRQQIVSARIIDVDATVRLLEPMLQPLIGARIELNLRLDSGGARVKVDPGQFDQILVNLVVNARDAMPDGGVITIETDEVAVGDQGIDKAAGRQLDVPPGRYAVVGVSDDGMGMDEATLSHAFDPFFTTKAPGKGTGLGLATNYGIARQAGGDIWVHSEPGSGSVFQVYLPIAEGPVGVPRSDLLAPPAAQDTGTALVVEDEPAVREVTTRLLQRAGYHVVAVADGAEALVASESQAKSLDVLVTDAVMPGMSGIELAGKIHQRHPNAAVIILSGYTAETLDLERVIAQGARFLAKPVRSRVLLAEISAALTERRSAAKPK